MDDKKLSLDKFLKDLIDIEPEAEIKPEPEPLIEVSEEETKEEEEVKIKRLIKLKSDEEIAKASSTLNAKQKEIFDDIIFDFLQGKENYAVIVGYAGTGKELANSEIVLTPNGWRQIGELKVGDKVNAPYGGRISNVEAVYPQGVKDIYRITFNDGSYVDAGLEHQWRVQTPKQTQTGNYWIRTTRELIKDYWKQNSNGRYRYSIDLVEPVYFNEQEIPLHPYLLGFLLGDGYLGDQVNITAIDNEDEKFNLLKDKIPNGASIKWDKKNHHIRFNSTLNKHLKKLGLHNKKSGDKFIPKCYLFNSTKIRMDILAGLLDADGSVDSWSSKTRFTSTSKQLRDDVVELVKSLGGSASKAEAHREHDGKPTEYNTQIRLKFNPFRLSYKKRDYSTSWKVQWKKRIVDIKYARSEEATCITVSDKSSLFITRGYTITHNTYLVSKIIEALDTNVKVAMTAPTNKAVKILADNGANIKADFATIHKLLALRVKWLYPPKGSKDKPKQILTQAWNAKPTVNNYSVLIVDEVSMLNDELFDKINDEVEDKTKIIFMGDPAQIPPVTVDDGTHAEKKRHDSIPLTPTDRDFYNIRFYELDQIMRQANGNTIVDIAYVIRQNRFKDIDAITDSHLRHDTANVRFYSEANKVKFYTKMLDMYNSEEYKKDGDYAKVLAWTNARVNFFNKLIRSSLFGHEADETPYMIGEKLIADKPIIEGMDIIFNTSDEFTIEEIRTSTHEYQLKENEDMLNLDDDKDKGTKYEFNYWRCLVKDSRLGCKKTIKLLADESKPAFKFALSKLKRGKRWQEWTQLLEVFANVKYAYAITCHKAQGSTYGNVFLIEDDIDMNRRTLERNRIKYTAVTRASHELHILTSRI